jgi:hypothetical protein
VYLSTCLIASSYYQRWVWRRTPAPARPSSSSSCSSSSSSSSSKVSTEPQHLIEAVMLGAVRAWRAAVRDDALLEQPPRRHPPHRRAHAEAVLRQRGMHSVSRPNLRAGGGRGNRNAAPFLDQFACENTMICQGSLGANTSRSIGRHTRETGVCEFCAPSSAKAAAHQSAAPSRA